MRSPTASPAAVPQKTVFDSIHGTVRVYTRRHIHGCLLLDPNLQHCRCPKWIYLHPRAGEPMRKAARTGSFTEACEEAAHILRGFDPEIRAAREKLNPAAAAGVWVQDAISEYLDVLARRGHAPNYVRMIAQTLEPRRPTKRNRHGDLSFLDFLVEVNLRASAPVTRMEEITTELLDEWQSGWRVNDLSAKSKRDQMNAFLGWARARKYLKEVPEFSKARAVRPGNRCGHFTDEQMQRIFETIPFHRPDHRAVLANYTARLRAFVELGRWGGMALADIARFSPALNLGPNNVLTYRRAKVRSSVAMVLLDPALAQRLRSIPAEEGSDPARPFHFPQKGETQNSNRWRNRFQKLCAAAGITEIETELGTRRKPHPHMLRDTFAIDAISRGVTLDNVAKMLGHSTVAMTQRSYLFWIQKRIDHCIEDQRAALARVQVLPLSA